MTPREAPGERQFRRRSRGPDYQATVTGDLAGWQAGLHAVPDVTNSTDPRRQVLLRWQWRLPNPGELASPQRADSQLVTDINEWRVGKARSSETSRLGRELPPNGPGGCPLSPTRP